MYYRQPQQICISFVSESIHWWS